MYNSNDVATRIKQCAEEKKISIRQVLINAGLGFNTMTAYKTSMPKADNLAKIADVLDCSVDYLLGREVQKKEPAAIFEDERQAELNAIFERMPDEESKDKLIQLVRSFEITNKYEIGHRYIGGIAAKGGNKPIIHRIPPKKK